MVSVEFNKWFWNILNFRDVEINKFILRNPDHKIIHTIGNIGAGNRPLSEFEYW